MKIVGGMKVFDKGLIDELAAELLNQYLNVVWLEEFMNKGLGHIELHVTCDLKEGDNPRTIQEGLKLATDIKVNLTKKRKLGSQQFQTQLYFS